MSNARAALRRVQNNTPMPGGTGAAEQTVAGIIGETVALHLGKLLQQLRPACIVCCTEAKLAERAHQVAVANAQAAAEPVPEAPEVGLNSSITAGPAGPVCWAHFEPGE